MSGSQESAPPEDLSVWTRLHRNGVFYPIRHEAGKDSEATKELFRLVVSYKAREDIEGYISAIKSLGDRKAAVRARDDAHKTPLHYAVIGFSKPEDITRIVEAFRDLGANLEARGYDGLTPEDFAKKEKRQEIDAITRGFRQAGVTAPEESRAERAGGALSKAFGAVAKKSGGVVQAIVSGIKSVFERVMARRDESEGPRQYRHPGGP